MSTTQEQASGPEVSEPPPGTPRVRNAAATRAATIARQGLRSLAIWVGLIIAVGAVWELAKALTGSDDSVMPHTWSVIAQLGEHTYSGQSEFSYVAEQWLVTFRNSATGFVVGSALGLLLGVLIVRNRAVGAALYPLAVLAQTVPIVAVAPALVLWLGTGVAAKVLVAAYLTFFPVTVATVKGIQSVPRERLELMQICAAKPRTVLLKMQLPAALPLIFIGLETAAGVAVVGAIVAELPFGSDSGIGLVILTAWQYYALQPEALYVAVLASCLLGVVAVLIVRMARSLIPAASQPTDVML